MAFVDTSLVALRESLEALLILGILLGVVTKLGQPRARAPLLWGAAAGLGVSILLGILAAGVAEELYEDNEALFEGVASLLAVTVLTYMIVWMYRHTQGMVGMLQAKTREALVVGGSGVLFGLAFIAVLREGIETVVFTAGKFPVDGALVTITAILTGIAASAVLAFLVFSGFLRLSIERFMLATGLVLVVIAGGLLGYGIHELAEVGEEKGVEWVEEIPLAYDLRETLPHKATGAIDTPSEVLGTFLHGVFVYRANPTWLEVGLWVAYVGGMGAWILAKLRKHPKPTATPTPPPVQNAPEVA